MNPFELLGDDDASVEQLSKKVAAQATVSKPAAAASATPAAAPKTSGTFVLRTLESAFRVEQLAMEFEA